jgi:hypothetical protein
MEKIDLTIYRGETKTFTFGVLGDKTTDKLYFTAKPNRDLTSSRLVDKGNSVAESTGVEATTSVLETVTYTEITVFFVKEDTQDLEDDTLEYDILAVDPTDPDIREPLVSGTIMIEQNVRGDYDGSSLAGDASTTRTITLEADNLNDDDFIVVDTVDGEKEFVIKTKAEVQTLLGLGAVVGEVADSIALLDDFMGLILEGDVDFSDSDLEVDMGLLPITIDLEV